MNRRRLIKWTAPTIAVAIIATTSTCVVLTQNDKHNNLLLATSHLMNNSINSKYDSASTEFNPNQIYTNTKDSEYKGVTMQYKYHYQILKTKDRTSLASSISDYNTTLEYEPDFPGYPSIHNRWDRLDSNFAQKVGINSNNIDIKSNMQNLFNKRVEWRRKIILEDAPLNDGNYLNFDDQNRHFTNHDYQKDSVEKDVTNKKYIFTDPNWVIGQIQNHTLKKHPAIEGMFGKASVPNTQKAVDKAFDIDNDMYGQFETGLYAPAGEVITLKLSLKDAEQIKLLKPKLIVGDEWRDIRPNGNKSEVSFRMPRMRTEFDLNSLLNESNLMYENGKPIGYQIKFGSVFGGSISFKFTQNIQSNNKEDLHFEIDDAVEHLIWINGYTTNQEWQRLANTTKTPIITLVTDHSVIYKPTVDMEDDNKLNIEAKTHNPSSFAWNMGIVGKTSAFMKRNDTKTKRIVNNAFYVNDYVPAGGALNAGGVFELAPMYWLNDLLNDSPQTFSAQNNWGVMHEFNHSYAWNQFGKQNPGEVTNNVDNMIEMMVLDKTGTYRNETNITGVSNPNSWQVTSSPFASLLVGVDENNQFKTTKDIWNAWAQYMHIVGPEIGANFIRIMARPQNDRAKVIGLNSPVLKIVGDDIGLQTAYIMNSFANLDLTDWMEHSDFFKFITDKYNPESLAKWTELKTYIKTQFKEYHPFATLYSSGNFTPNLDGTYNYNGDATRPYQVSLFTPTTFDFAKFTRFSDVDQNGQVTTLKSIKVIEGPKLGTYSIDPSGTKLIYQPNKNCQPNWMDKIIVELTDSNNNTYRTLVRPLLSPSINNAEIESFDIIKDQKIHFDDGQEFVFDNNNIYNRSDLRDNPFNSEEDINNPNNSKLIYRKKFFLNFDKYISQVSNHNDKHAITLNNEDGLSYNKIRLKPLSIARIKTMFKPSESGNFKTLFNPSGDSQTTIVVKDTTTNQTQFAAYTNAQHGINANQLQQVLHLNKDHVYEIQVYLMRNVGWNNEKTIDFKGLKLLKIDINNQIDPNQNVLTNHITSLENYINHSKNIFNWLSNYTPRFYSWALENMNLYNGQGHYFKN